MTIDHPAWMGIEEYSQDNALADPLYWTIDRSEGAIYSRVSHKGTAAGRKSLLSAVLFVTENYFTKP